VKFVVKKSSPLGSKKMKFIVKITLFVVN